MMGLTCGCSDEDGARVVSGSATVEAEMSGFASDGGTSLLQHPWRWRW